MKSIRILFATFQLAGLFVTGGPAEDIGKTNVLSPELQRLIGEVDRLVETGRAEEAIPVCSDILKKDIDKRVRVAILKKRGGIYGYLNKYELALADMSAVTSLLPENAEALCALAEVLRHLGRYGEAISNHTRAIQLQADDWELYFSRGVTYEEFGYFAEALKDFSQAIRLNPSGAVYYHRGDVALSCDRYEEAESDLARAAKLGVNDAKCYSLLGQAYYYLGKRKEAQLSFEHAAALQARTEGGRLAVIGSYYGDLLEFQTALKFFDQAVAADPTNANFLTNRGLVRQYVGDTDGAWEDLKKSLHLGSCGFLQYGLRAWLQFVKGQYEQSVQDNEILSV